MRTILSPAKNIEPVAAGEHPLTRPVFLGESARIARVLSPMSPWEMEGPFQLSPTLALRAAAMNQTLDLKAPGSPALLAFRGLQYQHLSPETLSPAALSFAGEHLFILSAFYGLLRPFDGILPHRLELVSKIRVEGESLYRFWGDKIHRELFRTGEPVLNLTSGEYTKAVAPHLRPGDGFITCDFLLHRKGRLQMLPTEAKMARGRMARFIAEGQIDRPEGVRDFAWNGYTFLPALSGESRYCFVKDPLGE